MKNILIVVALIIGALIYVKQHRHAAVDAAAAAGPPAYMEMRITMDVPGRQIEGVVVLQANNEADCRDHIARYKIETNPTYCPICKFKSADCLHDLTPRYTKMFSNAPVPTTYASVPKGKTTDRDYRMLFWGLSIAESDKVCDYVVGQMHGVGDSSAMCVKAAG